MPRDRASEKSFTYCALLDAFGKDGCPICRLMAEYSLNYLDALFYEQVNDVHVRRKLRASRGFCNWHAWQARQVASSALGVSIMARDLISEEMTRLDDLLRKAPPTRLRHGWQNTNRLKSIRAFIWAWQQKEVCPACQVIIEHERHMCETILNLLHEEDFTERFERAAPLCISHTTQVIADWRRHPALPRLIALQHHKYASLVSQLEEFCRKHDYRYAHESWGSESNAWLRAIELLAGKPEIFGNDIHRREIRDGISGGWGSVWDWARRWMSRGAPDGMT
jgi:hypothetical protein